MAQSKLIYLGVRGSVIALDAANGRNVWTTRLRGSNFVNVVLQGKSLYAATQGEAFCLDARTGDIRWHNALKGYGWGLVSFAGEGVVQDSTSFAEEKRRIDEQNAAAAAT